MAFSLLEIVFVGVIYAAYLHFRYRRSREKADAVSGRQSAGMGQYPANLQEAILQADSRLARLGDDETSRDQRRLLEMHLAWLKAERKAVEQAGEDEDRRWDILQEELAPLLPGEIQKSDEGKAQVEALHLRVRSYEQRLANLEKFRTLFFELKSQLADSSVRNEKLHTEVRRSVPVEEQSPELKKLLEELENENRQLNDQIEHVEDVFEDIIHHATEPMEAGSENIAGKLSGIDRGVESIRNIIVRQEARIGELVSMVTEKDIALSDREQLQQMLEELREANQEMETVISVLGEENTFLQEQISTLLTQELGKDEEYRQKLEKQEEAYAELSDKFSAMEKEYLQMYEENRTLKGGDN